MKRGLKKHKQQKARKQKEPKFKDENTENP